MPERGRASAHALPLRAILTYTAPAMCSGFLFFWVSFFYQKFATDVLLLAPVSLLWIFVSCRVWDAVSDPLVGFQSDRTCTRLGRRRPWMLASAVPLSIAIFMLWGPPSSLAPGPMVAWVAFATWLFYTALTMLEIPHAGLGAELSADPATRIRVFGMRRMMYGSGALLTLPVIWLLTRDSITSLRETVLWVALGIAVTLGTLVVVSTLAMRERADYAERGGRAPLSALRDVVRNAHARIWLSVTLIQQIGIGCLVITTPYFLEYVVGDLELTFAAIGLFLVSWVVAVPLWMRAARRFDKRSLLLASMWPVAFTIGSASLVGAGDVACLLVIVFLTGMLAAGMDSLGMALYADVVDVDELSTGERKEGTYFAAATFAAKLGAALAAGCVNLGLWAVEYVPGAEQPAHVKLVLRCLFCIVPALCYATGAALFTRFALDGRAHAEVLLRLRERAQSAARSA
jgi:GPH family glycoside/pentoside/hexuronide:cation symporter